ncbi:MAG TPA: UDP-N-acetylglucosamine--N-acetylmuramyl-(pentapeptide) pyrophosphoryl-undecaprenol N-acetylglucosamine transferase [Candidatus Eisenbacteria bacterium]|nr:UDP-N-acetylglucosamine--N-acetylmuramyl-(pentapeptide) pyrophosphoryl-undecaprenol N-acetylglucosamine transferase [Candidatus Eisenbacteria bacterium]
MAPALGFLNSLPQAWDVVYIGRKYAFEGDLGTSLEYETIKKQHIRFIPFTTGRLQRKFTSRTLPSLGKIPVGFFNALLLLKKEKPDVIMGFGGYLSVPICLAARLLSIPFLIHESSLGAGLANRILAPFATKVCISWDSSRAYFPSNKTILTGNPFLPFDQKLPKNLLPESVEALPLLFVAGGSGGSHIINTKLLQNLPLLLEKFRIIHQTGSSQEFGDFEKLLKEKEKLSKQLQDRYSVMQFIDPDVVNSVFANADLFIGRSGINTVATLYRLKKKAILIPLSVGQKNEQMENAKLLEAEGLGYIVSQNSLSLETLLQAIEKLQKGKTQNSPKWGIPILTNGAENLVKEVAVCTKLHPQEK